MNLRIVGPTPMPPEVEAALARPMLNHRGEEFQAIFRDVNQRLRSYFQTGHDVFVIAASGTGGLEAAVANTISPGDKVLACVAGVFGERFAKIAAAYGADVVRLEVEWGTAVLPEMVAGALRQHPDTAVVLLTYNETSTGVTHPLQPIVETIRSRSEAVICVDAISALGAINMPMDDWGIDVAVTGSQKAWMIPPGLAMIGVSARVLQRLPEVASPRFYWDFGALKKGNETDRSPFTPAIGLFFALQVALDLMDGEGRDQIFARHERVAVHTRQAVRSLGLDLFAEPTYASNTVTSIRVPEGLNEAEIRRIMHRDYEVVIAGGQSQLKGKILRIGHLGACVEAELDDAVQALDGALRKLGWRGS